MSVRVSIFNKRAYREFTLTSYLSHADKRLLIDADLFWIEENVELLLETAEGKWVIRQDESYKLFSGDLSAPCQQDILLCDGQILAIETVEGERLNVYISVSEESIVPFAKYEILKGAMSFAIGNHPDRDILYCPGETFLQAFAKDEGRKEGRRAAAPAGGGRRGRGAGADDQLPVGQHARHELYQGRENRRLPGLQPGLC